MVRRKVRRACWADEVTESYWLDGRKKMNKTGANEEIMGDKNDAHNIEK